MDDKDEEIGHAGYLTRAVFDAAYTYSKTAAGSPAQEKELLFSGLMIGMTERRDRRIDELLEANSRYLIRARAAEGTNSETRNEAQLQISAIRVELDALREASRKRDAEARAMTADREKVGSFTFLEVEAALCVWEWMIGDGADRVEEWRDAVGTVELRHASYSIGRYCLKIYDLGKQIAGEEAWGGVPYDWEVIPAICNCLHYGAAMGWIAPGSDEDIARQALKRIDDFREKPEEPAKPVRQYFYRINECTAADSRGPDCICWHDEGTGPMPYGYSENTTWREKPAGSAQVGDELIAIDGSWQPPKPIKLGELRKNPQAEALAALVLEMAEAVDAAAEDVGTGSRGPVTILREAVKVAEAMKGDDMVTSTLITGATLHDYRMPRRQRHKITDGTYDVLGVASLQAATGSDIQEGCRIVFYRSDKDGSLWARELSEFDDGRFEAI